jgi:hypothetical protein
LYSKTKDVFVSALSPFDGQTICIMWTKHLDLTHYVGNDREDDFVSSPINSDWRVGVCFNSTREEEEEDGTGASDSDSLEEAVDPSNTIVFVCVTVSIYVSQ